MSNSESDTIHINVSLSGNGGSESVDIVRAKYEKSKRRRRVFNSITLVSIGLLLLTPGCTLLIKSIFFPRPATRSLTLQQSYERLASIQGRDSERVDASKVIAREEEGNADDDRDLAVDVFIFFAVPAVAFIVVGVIGIIRRGDDSYRVLDDSNFERVRQVGEEVTDPDYWMKVAFLEWCTSVSWVMKYCWASVFRTRQNAEEHDDV